MPKAPKPPPPVDPTAVSNAQQGYNLQGGQQTQSINTINQSDPTGSKTYGVTIDPLTGLADYTQSKQYSPVMQALFDTLMGSKGTSGGGGSDLWDSIIGSRSQDPDFVGANGAGALVNQQINAQNPAWERFMAPAREQLDTHLRNQGILPGTPAYQQQVDALTNQQGLTKGQWLSNFEPQAFQQAKEQWALPVEMAKNLSMFGAPSDMSFDSTPTANVGAADYQGTAIKSQEQAFKNYQEKVKSQNAMMNMITQGAGLALAIPTGGASLLASSALSGGGGGGLGAMSGLMG
jgi:hypothetical protein